jgi:hypothetical protein
MGELRGKEGDRVKGEKWRIRINYKTNGKEIKLPLGSRKPGKQEEYV